MEVYENEPFELADRDRAHVAAVLGGRGGYFQRHADGWLIRRVVGHLRLPSGEVLHIRSRKADAASLLSWVAYADPSLRALRVLGALEDAGAPGSFAAIVARLFAIELLRAAAHNGLARHYERQTSMASVLRGRIDFAAALKRGGQLAPIPCVVWDRTPNTPVNRFLAAAVHKLGSDLVMRQACARELPALTALMADIRPAIDPCMLDASPPLASNQRGLKVACLLAQLIVRLAGLVDGDTAVGAAFLLNLEALFERSVVQAFRDAAVSAIAQYPVRYEQACGAKPMTIDLFVPGTADTGPIVVDAKYKTAVDSANLQQMVTYCYLTGARRACLVLPAGHRAPSRFVFRAPDGTPPIVVETVELATGARNLEGWRAAGAALVSATLASAALRGR